MKLSTAVAQLVRTFGTQGDQTRVPKITKACVAAFGDRDVSDSGFEKLVKLGHALQKLGVK